MSCTMSCIKILLFVFNFIFCLCGLALLIPGILIQVGIGSLDEMEGDFSKVNSSAIALIVIGAIIFVIAFFGCCGAIRESHCMIITFAVFLLTILVVQVAIAIYAFLALKNVDPNTIANSYEKSVADYWRNDGDRILVDFTQTAFECCGAKGPSDYDITHEHMNGTLPLTCCPEKKDEILDSCSVVNAYNKGCTNDLIQFFKDSAKALGALAIGIAAVELIGIIFALCLANSIRNDDRRGYRV